MEHFNLKKFLASVLATACCINTLAYYTEDPILKHDIVKTFDYEQNNWMSQIPLNTPLNKISMVSSHDAGMDENNWTHPTEFSATQFHNIYDQAKYGVRFFDIRLRFWKGGYYAMHGIERGIFIDRIFDQAIQFLIDNPTEVLIIELSHWFDEGEMKNALKIILQNENWTQHLYRAKDELTRPPLLNEVTLDEVKGKLIIIVEDTIATKDIVEDARDNRLAKQFGFTPAKGIWQFAALAGDTLSAGKYGFFRLYDSYSNTPLYDTMRDNQAKKFHNFFNDTKYNKETDAFIYCWQLTYGSIYLQAEKCNPHLETELNTVIRRENNNRPNLVNLDYVDSRICNIVINLNADLLNKNVVSYIDHSFNESTHELYEQYRQCSHYAELKGTYDNFVSLTNGWYVVNGDVIMKKGAAVECEAVHIILKDNSQLTITGYKAPGIRADETFRSLHIYAQSTDESTMGKMTVTGGKDCAAIGGPSNRNGENINIHGGQIDATGGTRAAGIGGGDAGSGRNISIYGGIVSAKSSQDGAAIGGGRYYFGGGSGENITIYGGKVIANASKESTTAAGIGGGDGGHGRNIKIYGGDVTATGTIQGAGIGGGATSEHNGGAGDGIYIYGGIVKATGGSAIGGGLDGSGMTIEIHGGKVYATAISGSYAAAIGGGYKGGAKDITISGGHVIVTGSKSAAAGIGGGREYNGGGDAKNIKITGGTIEISDVTDGHSIGAANACESTNIVISGGSVWASCGKGVDNPTDGFNQAVRVTTVPECGSGDTPVHLQGIPSYGCKDMFPKSGDLKIWLPDGSYNFSSDKTKYHANVTKEKTEVSISSRSIEVIVGPSGYATIYSDKKLIIPENVQAFAYDFKYGTDELHATSVGSGQVLPADQGYVIKASEGTYHFFETNGTPVSVTSILKGVLSDKPVSEFYPGKVYGLGRVNGKTAFYKYTADKIKAGKAYLIK